MSFLRKNPLANSEKQTFAHPKRKESEVEPKPGLAYTPADMARMHASGMPVNNANLVNQFYDGDNNPSWEIPLERQRGLDPAEIWEQSVKSKQKIKKMEKGVKQSKKQ